MTLGLAAAMFSVAAAPPNSAQHETATQSRSLAGEIPQQRIRVEDERRYAWFTLGSTFAAIEAQALQAQDLASWPRDKLAEEARSAAVTSGGYKGLYLLSRLQPRSAVPIVEDWLLSEDGHKRAGAWRCLCAMHKAHPQIPEINEDVLLRSYSAESYRGIRQFGEVFFAESKAGYALDALIRALDDPKRRTPWTVCPLGAIGDARAVPAILRYKGAVGDPGLANLALGNIATPEALDHLIAHVAERCAAEALADAKWKPGIPAIRRRLEELGPGKAADAKYEYADARVALIRLESNDPVESLMRAAEDEVETLFVRLEALQALRRYDCTRIYPRLQTMFTTSREKKLREMAKANLVTFGVKVSDDEESTER